MDLMDELKLAEETARQAGALLLQIVKRPLSVLSSEGKDIKLQADRDSEALIVDALSAATPYPILAEEGGERGKRFDEAFWVIDPLDGTLNYSRGIPVCCVSIALVDGSDKIEKPLAAVIFDFNRDEMFTAAAGHGAWLNGLPMRVSSVKDPAQAVLSTGFPSYIDYSAESLMPLVRRVQVFKKVRMIGAAAISLAWVACGRLDAYAENGAMLWDVAAGRLLVSEAGGCVECALMPSGGKKWARRVRAAAAPALWGAEQA
jgi:myo-inositol-1(or 4)-monophosphatase